MITRLFIVTTAPDARASVRKHEIESIGVTVLDVRLVDVYTIDKNLSRLHLSEAGRLLANPITQRFFIGTYLPDDMFHFAIEVGFLPGVTDNVGATTKECLSDRLKTTFRPWEGIYTSQITLLSGQLQLRDIERITSSSCNPLIQRISIKNRTQYLQDMGMDVVVPKVRVAARAHVDTVDLNIDEAALADLGKNGIKNSDDSRRGPLALDVASMKAIQKYYKNLGRMPTDVELESIAQTWSEHCKHTIFARPLDEIKDGLYKHYIKRATEIIRKKLGKRDFCVSVFTDNSGAITFDKDYLVTHKVETHNSPSALDPFGGAITGIVGVNRDAIGFGLGAKPIANTYGFCFGMPSDNELLYRDKARTQAMLPPRRIMDGVIAGVNSGGNCSGIPTPQGFIYFDPRFVGKPLVFVGTVGLIPKKKKGTYRPFCISQRH